MTRWKFEWAADLGYTGDPERLSFFAYGPAGVTHVNGRAFFLAADELADAGIDVLAATPEGKFPPKYWAEKLMSHFDVEYTNDDVTGYSAPDQAKWVELLTAELT